MSVSYWCLSLKYINISQSSGRLVYHLGIAFLSAGGVTDKEIIPILFATTSVVNIYSTLRFLPLLALPYVISRCHICWSGLLSPRLCISARVLLTPETDISVVYQAVLCFKHPKVEIASLLLLLLLLWQHNIYTSAACAQIDPLLPCIQNYFLDSHSPFCFCTVEHIFVNVAFSRWSCY